MTLVRSRPGSKANPALPRIVFLRGRWRVRTRLTNPLKDPLYQAAVKYVAVRNRWIKATESHDRLIINLKEPHGNRKEDRPGEEDARS